MARITREKLGQVVTVAGMAAALPSVWQTVTHITDDTYRAPEARDGAGHVQYHMAREALITAGSLAAVGIGVAAGPRRGRPMWGAMAAAGAGFAAAMWSGGPTAGVWAPHKKAFAVHVASTTGLVAGICLLRPGRGRR
ncbi:hypothetical protein OG727_01355 [Streptomyces caniferus]|uniref:DUF998 domain-containing protein n=1 Tax=Streptomyces caniferus TaxID=285557 RepID=A0ABZ1VDY1_9ACTN|nr:hypothetical protein [Streptomyces caniferus]